MKFGLYGKIRFFLVWTLVFTLAFPAPLFSGTISSGDPNEMVLRRLNSPERAAASARMHEEYAKQQAELAASEGKEKTASKVEKKPSASPSGSLVAGSGAAGTQKKTSTGSANVAPRSATEVIFNQGASLVGLPGLAPREGVDGSRDEGRGFHQDGTARRVDTDDGRRTPPAYMRAGLSGQEKITPGLYDDAARLEELASSGGRISGQSSREFDSLDPNELFLNRGLNYGSGIVNSWGESVLSGLVDGGRARLNYRLDSDGDVAGEGDALFPWYDGTYTTVFTQIGARSMTDDEKTRWIGNFGLGQRWFPFASGEIGSPDYDAGTLMVGYNAFFDYDFTRSHQRGGVGAELQYDWLRLSSNYYFPLSDWKGSYDFDSSLVEERPAEGWDARIKAYLPFYRNVALTGSYSRWYGDNVGVYGASDLEKNPRVWSYGIEYTPVPLVSAFLRQKSTEHGRTDTEFGLTFNYHFGMSLEEQTSPTKVAELRTVGGSRHEFVDRENKIILEYRAKNAFRIEYVGKAGTNRFNFRLVNGFDKTVSGQMVHASVTDATFPNGTDFATFVTGGNGEFTLALDTVTATPVPATIQAGETTGNFNLDAELTELNLKANPDALIQHKPQDVKFTVTRKDGSPMSGASVVFDSSAAFTGLSGTYTTDGSGNFTVPGLTAVLSGEQPLSAKVNGKTTAKTQFSVTAATYVLNADKDTLNQHEQHDVTFTLTRNGEAVPGLSVLFTKGEGFASLPADAQVTDASGQFKVTGLTPILSGQQTVEVLVDGEGKAQVPFTVTAAGYKLTATPDTLLRYEATDVTFTLMTSGGAVVPNVSVSILNNPNFSNLPASENTGANGEFTVSDLTALATGAQSVEISVGGQKASVPLTVNEGDYSLSTTDRLTQWETPQPLTFTLKTRNNKPVSGADVSYTISGLGNNADLTGTAKTNSSGEFTVNGVATTLSSAATASVTVDGKQADTTIGVTSASYTLNTTDTLEQWEPAKTVTFTVKTANNTPVSGADVDYTISGLGNNADISGTATTGSDGTFKVDNIATTLSTDAKASVTLGNRTVETPITVTGATYTLSTSDKLAQRENARPLTFTLKTYPNNTPVRNAEVTYTISNLGGTAVTGTATTNDNGEFTTAPVATTLESMADVEVTVDGKTVSGTIDVTSATYKLSTSDTLEQWEPDKSLTFTLTTYPNNTPVKNAEVTYTISKLGNPDVTGTATTDNNGTFKVDVATTLDTDATASVTVDGKPVTATIKVTAATYKLSTTDTLEQWGAAKTVTFTLTTSHGTPVPGATVAYLITGLSNGNITGSETSNDKGQFTVAGLSTNSTSDPVIYAQVNNGNSTQTTINVDSGGYTLTANDSLDQWGTPKDISFKLTSSTGTVADATVNYLVSGLSGEDVTGETTTNGNGTFTIPGLSTTSGSNATVRVTVNGSGSATATLTVNPTVYTLTANGSLDQWEAPEDVSFSLTVSTGTVSSATVGYRITGLSGGDVTGETTTNGNGTFTIPGLSTTSRNNATVSIRVNGRDSATTTLAVNPASYTLTSNNPLTQYVTGDAAFSLATTSGRPVADMPLSYTITGLSTGTVTGTTTTDDNGRFTVYRVTTTGMAAASVNITVDSQTVETTLPVVQASLSLTSENPIIQHESRNATFTLKAGSSVVPNVALSYTITGLSTGTVNGTSATDGNGQFTIQALTSRTTTPASITVYANGGTAGTTFNVTPATYKVISNDKLEQWEPASPVTFTLTTSYSTPVPRMETAYTISGLSGSNVTGSKTTGDDGTFTVDNVATTLSSAAAITVTVEGKTADTTLDVTPAVYKLSTTDTLEQWDVGKAVTFTLTTSKGTLINGASVSYTISGLSGAEVKGTAVTSSNGTFTTTPVATTLGTEATASVTVDGRTANTTISVTAANYVLSTTDTLEQWEPGKPVTFTLKSTSGLPISNAPLSYTISGLSGAEVKGTAVTSSNGTFTTTPVATRLTTAANVSITVAGKQVDTIISVTAANYKLSTTDSLVQYDLQTVTFTLTTSKNTPVPNVTVNYTLSGLGSADVKGTVNTSNNSTFTVTDITTLINTEATASVTVDGKQATATIPVKKVTFKITNVTGGGAFNSSTTATFTAQMLADGEAYTPSSPTVTWSVTAADNSANKAVVSSHKTKRTGLAWGSNGPGSSAGNELTASTTSRLSGSTGAQIHLTDIMGQRTVTVQASVSFPGHTLTATKEFTFGAGPLSVFAGAPKGNMTWKNAVSACGGTGNLNTAGYQPSTKLPSAEQLQAVAASTGNDAYLAAGWPNGGSIVFYYWAGETNGDGFNARYVALGNGHGTGWFNADRDGTPIAVCLP